MTDATSRLNVEINSKPAKSGADEVINQFKRMQQFSKGMWGTFSDASKSSYSTVTSYIRKIKSEFSSLGDTIAAVGKGIRNSLNFTSTAISSLGLYALFKAITDVGLATIKFTNLLTISVGSVKAAGRELDNLKKLANELGLVYKDAVIPYAKFFAASVRSISGDDIRDIFKAFGEATVALKLNKQEVQGVFLALQQMSSKGKVSMEELRLQLAERIPGAMQLAADAMGMTIQELEDNVKKGLVSAADLLPKFAAEMHKTFGAAAELASKSVIGSFARLENAVFEFMSNLANGGYLDAVGKAADTIASWLNGNSEAAKALGIELGQIATDLARIISDISPEDIKDLFNSVKTTLGTIHQVFINLSELSFVKWLVGDIRPNHERVLDKLKETQAELSRDLDWEKRNIYGVDEAEVARLESDLATVTNSINQLESAMSRANGTTKATTINITKAANDELLVAKAQQEIKLAIAATNEAIYKKSQLLERTAEQELAQVQKELSYYRDRLDNYEEYGLSLTDITVLKTKLLGLLDREKKLLSDVAKNAAEAADEFDKMSKEAIEAIEKENEFILKESNRLVSLAAQYGSTAAQIILYNNELAELERAMIAIGATESEIVAARKKLWDEGPGKEAADAAEEASKEWKKTTEKISDFLTDALFEGFENGKTFAENFRDTVVNMFKTMVLRPIVQAIIAPVAGQIASGASALLGESGLGLTDTLSLANSGSSLFSAGGILGEGVGYALNYGASVLGGAGASQAAMLASQTAVFGAEGAALTASSLGASTVSSVASALPYIGWAIAGIGLIASFMKDIPSPRFNISGGIGDVSLASFDDVEQGVAQKFVDTINDFEKAFLTMLSDAEREAIEGFVPDLHNDSDISAHGDAGTENELAQVILTRMTMTIRQLDTDIADAMREGILDIKGSREFTMEDVKTIVDEVLAPILYVRESLNKYFGGADDLGNIAEVTEVIVEAAGSLANYSTGLATYLDKFFTEEEKAARMTETLTAIISELGLDAIPQSRQAFRELVESLDLTTEEGLKLHGALIALAPSLDEYFTALAGLGQATDDITGSIGDLTSELEDFMVDIEDQFAELTLSDFQQEMRNIAIWFEEASEKAQSLGASTEQLAMIQEIAAIRTANAIRELENSIADLISQLYGGSSDSALSSINDQISLELSRIQSLNREANDLYNTEMRRYQDSAVAIDRISDHLMSLSQGSLSPLTPLERYNAARSNYDVTLASAMSGDSNALNDILARHTEFLSASQFYNASSTPYINDYNSSIADLQALAVQLGLIDEPTAPDDITTSELLAILQAQRDAIIAEQEQADRAALALELASQIGDLGLALDTSVWDLLAANGINIQQLADDLGINIGVLNEDLVNKLIVLKDALHVDFIDLAQRLGIDLVALAQEFGFDVVALGEDLDNWLVRAANNIGSSIFDLATTLGVDIDSLGSLLSNDLTDLLSPLSADIRAELSPYLTAIRSATDTAELELAMSNLRLAVDALPEGERQKLSPYLNNIFAATDGTESAVLSQTNPITSTYEQMVYNNGWLSGIEGWTNLSRQYMEQMRNTINNYQWKITRNTGKLVDGLTSFAGTYMVGTNFVPRDMMAGIHFGEMVIDPKSSDVLRRYGIQVSGASNDRFYSAVVDELSKLREEVNRLYSQSDKHHDDDMSQRDSIHKREMASNNQSSLVRPKTRALV